MRVLLVTGSFPPMRCGIGDYSYGLAQALSVTPSINIAVLTSAYGVKPGKENGIEIFPFVKSWSFIEAFKVIKIIRHWSPDIVHIQYPTQGYGKGFLPWVLPIIAFLMKKKVVQTWHESYGRRSVAKFFLKAIIPGGLIVVRQKYKENLPVFLRWVVRNRKFVFIRNASPFPKKHLDEKVKNDLRKQYLKGQERLIVYFGFVYPNKGVELLFEIADPVMDQIVIAGEIVESSDYNKKIMALAATKPWIEKVTVTGFLEPDKISALLLIADAVILPYRVGGGEWNTSIHAAVVQGSFVITTSQDLQGYDEKHNVFYTTVDDEEAMRYALDAYAGRKRKENAEIDRDEWKEIANKHCSLYEDVLCE